MNASVIIAMKNAAFDHPEDELVRIFRDLANRVEQRGLAAEGPIRDINGNYVGDFTVTGYR